MNSTQTPTAIEPDDTLAARADARLAHAYEQIARADEQIARVTERLSKLDHDDQHDPSAVQGRRTSRGSTALRGVAGLALGACIVMAAFLAQSPPGDKVKPILARWAPQLVSTLSSQPERPRLPAQLGQSAVQVAAAADPPAPQMTAAAESTPQVAAPQTATAKVTSPTAPPPTEQAELLRSMSRDLANLTQEIEQLKANQDQIASDNAKAIEQLKAGQDQVASDNAKAIEQLKAGQDQLASDNAKAIEQLKAGQEQMMILMAKASEKASEKASQQNQRPKTAAMRPAHAPRPTAAETRRSVPPPSPHQARAQPPGRAPLETDDQ